MSAALWPTYTKDWKRAGAEETENECDRDKKTYEKFQKIDKTFLSKHEAKQLKNLLKEFDEELNTGEELKKLRQKENEIAKRHTTPEQYETILKIDDDILERKVK